MSIPGKVRSIEIIQPSVHEGIISSLQHSREHVNVSDTIECDGPVNVENYFNHNSTVKNLEFFIPGVEK